MTINELRIGNLAQTQKGDLLRVCGINEVSVSYEVVDRSKYPLNYEWQAEPISITEDWLDKFKFKEDENGFIEGLILKSPNFDFSYYRVSSSEGLFYFEVVGSGDSMLIASINYVHQLQNIYFALTDKELELKTP